MVLVFTQVKQEGATSPDQTAVVFPMGDIQTKCLVFTKAYETIQTCPHLYLATMPSMAALTLGVSRCARQAK